MIEKEYKVRASTGKDESAEITIPTGWKRYHKIEFGDMVKILADGVIVILPPNASNAKEAEVRRFLEGDGEK